jgi:hypothetical protein
MHWMAGWKMVRGVARSVGVDMEDYLADEIPSTKIASNS